MRTWKEFQIAIQAYGRGFSLLFHNRVRGFLIIPILVNILLIFGGYSLLSNAANSLSDSLFNLLGAESWSFWGAEYFDEILKGLLHITFKILFFLFMLFYGGFIVIIIMSPFFSALSERVESIETQTTYPFSMQKLLQDAWRGVSIAVRNGFLQLLLSLLIFCIGFIPLVGFIAPILLFITSAYFYGFSFIDFAMERSYPSLKERVAFIRKHRTAAITNGAVFALSLLLPFCNLFLAVFAAIWSVIAATLTLLNIKRHEANSISQL